MVMMANVIACVIVFLHSVYGFLVDANINSSLAGSHITDSHYVTIIDFLAEEKEARHQLEQFAAHLQHDLIAVKREVDLMKSNNNSCLKKDVLTVKNQTNLLKDNILELKSEKDMLLTELSELKQNHSQIRDEHTELEQLQEHLYQNYSQLKTENLNIKQELMLQINESLKQEEEFRKFIQTQGGQDLENVTIMQNEIKVVYQKMESFKNQINSLVRNNQIRTQDFLALISENNNVKSRVTSLDRDDKKLKNETMNNISELKDISSLCNVTRWQIELQQKVAVYVCGTGDVQYRSGSVVKFENDKTSVGFGRLSNFHSTGIFTTEKEGLYLVSSSIMSSTSGAHYSIMRNGAQLVYVYTGDSCRSSHHTSHTGSMVAAVHLNIGDRIYVKADTYMNVHGPASCFTIVKIK